MTKHTLLAIDPGRYTGYALLDMEGGKTFEVGLLDRGEPYYRERLISVIKRADRLAIESQFIHTGKKQNFQTVQRIIEAKQEVVTLWHIVHGPNIIPLHVQPQQWQRSLGIRSKSRPEIKAESKGLASRLTERNITNSDMADAVNIGAYAATEIQAAEQNE